MTITRHTAADLFLLLIAALICGLLISCVYVVLRVIPAASAAFRCTRFPKYKQFMADVLAQGVGKASLILADIILCLLFALCLLVVSFVCNSGNFRLLSVIAMSLGYLLGASVFGKLIKGVFYNILFVFKWLFGVVLFPIAWIGQRMALLLSRIHKRILNKRSKRLMAKYTKRRIAQINRTTEFGLIEKYYKELLK